VKPAEEEERGAGETRETLKEIRWREKGEGGNERFLSSAWTFLTTMRTPPLLLPCGGTLIVETIIYAPYS
jgi:hypothetical protein